MYTIARLYPNSDQVKAAAKAFMAAGYRDGNVVYLLSEDEAAPESVAHAEDAAEGVEPVSAPAAPASVDVETAVTVGTMLGEHAEFYLSRLSDGRALLVATLSFMQSRAAERLLDAHGPLPDSHRPPARPFVPISEQATPFSNWLGLPVLSNADTPFSDMLGFGFKEEGLSHLSRNVKPLAPDFTFLGTLGSKASRDTMFPMSTKSDRLEGQHASFGLEFKSKLKTPLSSLLGVPLLSRRKRFLTR